METARTWFVNLRESTGSFLREPWPWPWPTAFEWPPTDSSAATALSVTGSIVVIVSLAWVLRRIRLRREARQGSADLPPTPATETGDPIHPEEATKEVTEETDSLPDLLKSPFFDTIAEQDE